MRPFILTHQEGSSTAPVEHQDMEENDTRFNLDQYIAMKVKKARLEEGLKITDVARISGISQGMVSKIENAQV
ncbi:helix-turn-helix transcriptional regulator, partial [Wenyingzhuangia sp. 1_MG-2023]|nr:helix-turn-helix transcriptional regulator [Wenyingzhuangia sp. 1_MG-2023]